MFLFLRIVGERPDFSSKTDRLPRESLSLVISLSFESFLCIYIPPMRTVLDRPGELMLTPAEVLG